MGTLYVVATPIGNLGDISIRASEVIKSVPVVVAEDTRVARKLIANLEASPRLLSFHRHSRESTLERIVELLAESDVALVSDAGTPGVNDPGAELVSRAAAAGVSVTALPGPSSIIAALSVSGFNFNEFTSFGYLPASNSKRRRRIAEIADCRTVAVCFEAPHRVVKALSDMAEVMPCRRIVVCRELTKMHEEIWRGTVADATSHFVSPRGEFVMVVAPADSAGPESRSHSGEEILTVADSLRRDGMSTRALASVVAERLGLSRREVYQALIQRE